MLLVTIGCNRASTHSLDLIFDEVPIKNNFDSFVEVVKPNIVDTLYNEIDDIKQVRVRYKSSEFTFNINSRVLTDYLILDSEFMLTNGKVRIGEDLERIKNSFKIEAVEESNYYVQGKKDSYIIFTLKNDKIIKIQLYNL